MPSSSSYGYVLLRAALERASGKDFSHLLQEQIFEPLRLSSTEADNAGYPSFYKDRKDAVERLYSVFSAKFSFSSGRRNIVG
ncbi:MAG: serine hydrolase [Ktedonobacteraceae bacterium]|nr:serine hydrolase [Ktedonobacteraceae bacterium]